MIISGFLQILGKIKNSQNNKNLFPPKLIISQTFSFILEITYVLYDIDIR